MATTSSAHRKYKGVFVSKTNTKKLYEKLHMKREQVIKNLVTNFCFIGEQCVKIARETGDYNDITGNLRSSIGYIVLNDGEVKKMSKTKRYKGKKGDGSAGVKEGQDLLKQLQAKFTWGVVLIICAGMNYAAFVEDVHGKHVLVDAANHADKSFQKFIKYVASRVENRK
ncbi:MAG: hypothetical protein NC411_01140 [Bacteroides sp.]|nr:hypothetical protein [Bacteroides sp.]